MQTNEYLEIPLKQITESGTNPRSTFDDALISELAASIKEKGLLSPVMVRPNKKMADTPSNGWAKYEIVAGARRLRASRIAGLKDIPCLVRELTDEEAFEIQIIENLQRKDVHPLDEAAAFQKMLENTTHTYTMDDIAAKVGKQKAYITQRLKLNDLVDSFKELFYSDVIQIGHAMELCRLQPDDQLACTKELIKKDYSDNKEYAAPLHQLKSFIHRTVLLDLSEASFPKDDATLYKKAGACTTCSKRSGYNLDLFNDIAESDRCFDGACFNKKKGHYMERVIESLSANLFAYRFITSYWVTTDTKKFPDVLGNRDYKEIEEGKGSCEKQIKGVYVDNGEEFASVIDICIDAECQVHWKNENDNDDNEDNNATDYIPYYLRDKSPRERFAIQLEEKRTEIQRDRQKRLITNLKLIPGYKTVIGAPLSKEERNVLFASLYEYTVINSVAAEEFLNDRGITLPEKDSLFKSITSLTEGEKNLIIRQSFVEYFEHERPGNIGFEALSELIDSLELGQEELDAELQKEQQEFEAKLKADFIKEHGFDPEDPEEKPIVAEGKLNDIIKAVEQFEEMYPADFRPDSERFRTGISSTGKFIIKEKSQGENSHGWKTLAAFNTEADRDTAFAEIIDGKVDPELFRQLPAGAVIKAVGSSPATGKKGLKELKESLEA